MGKPLDSSASFRPISLTSCVSKLFERIILFRLLVLERLHQAATRAITGCLSSSSILFLCSEASLPPLRVTLTYFTLSSYERAIRPPTSFRISSLARLGVKLRLFRSSWRAFTSTRPLMLPSTSPREALSCLPSLRSLESAFLHCRVYPFLSMLSL